MHEKLVLPRQSLPSVLADLSAEPGELLTMYVEPASFPGRINELLSEAPFTAYAEEVAESASSEAVVREAERYGTGAAIFWNGHGSKYIILPPFPVRMNRVMIGALDTSLLLEALEGRHTIGVVLVTWGSYGIGVFDGDHLIKSKVGTGHIHKEHKKGGWSQKRFARRTEEQRKDFLRRVSNRIEEILGKYTLDYIFFGGNRLIRQPLWHECRYLKAYRIPGRVLNIRYANRETLNNSLSGIMKSVAFTF